MSSDLDAAVCPYLAERELSAENTVLRGSYSLPVGREVLIVAPQSAKGWPMR